MTDKMVVLVTCGSAKEAAVIARALVRERLAACVNIQQSTVRSIYRWKGRVEEAQEHLLIIKTSRRLLADLQKEIERRHSYDVPEIIALPIVAGSAAYLAWVKESVQPASAKRARGRK